MLASEKELGLEYVFRYPLTPVPLSLCCSDGMMAKTKAHPYLTSREEGAAIITRNSGCLCH